MTPEHLHLALNHIVFIGTAAAIVPLAVGLVFNQRVTVASGLLLTAVCASFTGAVMGTGEAAYERYLTGPVAPLLSEGADYWLEEHEERAHTWSKLMYATAVAAVAGLAVLWWKRRWTRAVAGLVILLCLASTLAGIYIAESGGKIRRPDFQSRPVETAAEANSASAVFKARAADGPKPWSTDSLRLAA